MRYLRAYSIAIFAICLVAAIFADSLVRLRNTPFNLLAYVFVLGVVAALVPMAMLMHAGEFKHQKARNVPWEEGIGFFAYSRHIRFRAWVVGVSGCLVLWLYFYCASPGLKPGKGTLTKDGTNYYLVKSDGTIELSESDFDRMRLTRVLFHLQIAATVTWVAAVYYCLGLKWPLFDDTFQFNDLFESNTRR